MANNDLNKATTTNFSNTVPDFIVDSMALDVANSDGSETYVYFDTAPENFGYLLNHPQVSSPIYSLATWGFGQGYEAEGEAKVILPRIDGNGKETFNEIVWNHEVVKLGCGDAFMQIKRNNNGALVNLINISPERIKVVFKENRILRY